MAYRIYGEGEDTMLMVTVDGWEVFTITLEPVKPESREWLAGHIDKAFQAANTRSKKKAIAEHNEAIKNILGIRS